MGKKTISLKGIIIIISFLLSNSLMGTTYYVSNSGNDNNAGTSEQTAWATISKVNSFSLQPGDRVLFQAGNTWREELEIQEGTSGAGNRITYSRYGTGENPRIVGSVKAQTWTATAFSNRWVSATNVPVNPDNYAPGFSASGNIFFERAGTYPEWGYYRAYTSNLSNLTQEYDWTWNAGVLYVYAATDPDTRYIAIEAAQNTFCTSTPNTEASYFTVDGIDLLYAKGAGYHAGYPEAAGQTDITFRNCYIGYIGAKGQSFAYGIEAFHSNLLVENCTITDIGRRGISFNFYNADNIGTMSNIIIRNNVFKRGQHTTSLDLAWAVSDDMADVTGIYFYNNIVDDSEIQMRGDDEFSNQLYIEGWSTNTYNLYVVNNIFIKSTARNILMSGANNPHVWNNTIVGHNEHQIPNPYANVSFNSNTANKLINIDFRNNILYNDLSINTLDSYGLFAEYAPTTFEHIDYNIYWQEDVETDKAIIGYHGDYYNRTQWASWRSDQPSFDANSPAPTLPHFNDSSAFDFTLKVNSPAYGEGVVLPYIIVTDADGKTDTINKYDFAGNLRSRTTPSIGAYEYYDPDPTATDITSFSLVQQTGPATINSVNHTINLVLAVGTNLTSLAPTIEVSPGATINPASGAVRNFTNPVTYTVTAQDGVTQQVWTVTVTVVAASTATNITAFTVAGQTGSSVINATNHTVNVTMPVGTNLTSLTPNISVSAFATVNPASGVAQNFTNPVNYTVTAQDGVTQQIWVVTVVAAQSTAANITAFTIAGQTGTSVINATNHTVNVTMPLGTNLTSLTPNISVSAFATVNPASGVAQNFTNPVNYTVTAQDGITSQIWTVTVVASLSTATDITAFSISGQTGNSVINATNHTVSITMPAGTNVTNLIPSITVSQGATINPASGVARNFTGPLTYTVTAQDGVTQQVWTVTVTAIQINQLPVIVVNNESTIYQGLVYSLDASDSYDLDNEALTFAWTIPAEISASALTGPSISILPTENTLERVYNIGLSVSDGIATVSGNISLGIYNYDPDSKELNIVAIEASDYETGNEPENIIDNNINTRWSAAGDNAWLQFELENTSYISHFELSFHSGESRTSYFDIFASNDNENWELLLDNSTSCGFSPNLHAFAVPGTKSSTAYRYVRLVGHMNSVNEWNSYTEFKVFGSSEGPNATDEASIEDAVVVFPNPAIEDVYVKTEPESNIRVINLLGSVIHEQKTTGTITQIEYEFKSGTYLIQILNNNKAVSTKKLVVQ